MAIKIEIRNTEDVFELVHSDHNWWWVAYLTLIGAYTARFFESHSWLNIFVSIAFILIFGYSFLESVFTKKRLLIEKGQVFLYNYWPLKIARLSAPLESIRSATITTVFGQRSKKATIFVGFKTGTGKVVSHSYSCLRVNLDKTVADLEIGLRKWGIEPTVA